ncbi:MAG: coproporphyrinogen-III oxidase family protein [Candidatus Omnitrophota bacterium]|nr:coproporphyrinogen-III oxidase family protein [Candidatus Omnitrophota bacterium]
MDKIDLFERIVIDAYSVEIAFSGSGYEYPPMYLWREIGGEAVKAGWKKLLRGRDYVYPGIYLHIPFCASKCSFCQFFSRALKDRREIDVYLDYLDKEARLYKGIFGPFAWRTLYIGGGTPSLLSLRQLDRLFSGILYKYFNFSRCIQVAFESNPGSLDAKKLKLLKEYGVNRLTIGVQSMDEKVTSACGRAQKQEDVYRAFSQARNAGIEYISVDLMIGLPGQTSESIIDTHKRVYELKPDTVHFNAFFPSPPTQFVKSGGFLTERDIAHKNKLLCLAASLQDKKPIGNDEYGLPESDFAGRNIQLVDQIRHNSAYLGLGCSASSHINRCLRYMNTDDISGYYRALDKNTCPVFLGSRIDMRDEMIFYATANLRYKGISKKLFYQLFRRRIERVFARELEILEKMKKITVDKEYILSAMDSVYEYLAYSKYFYRDELLRKLQRIYRAGGPGSHQDYLRNFCSCR